MKTKHTPGPWHIVIDDTGDKWTGWPLCIGCSDPDKSIVRPGGAYPYEWSAAMSQREAVANAHLIAAAPELLEALKDMVHFAGLMSSADEFPEIEKARAAIAKATGGGA